MFAKLQSHLLLQLVQHLHLLQTHSSLVSQASLKFSSISSTEKNSGEKYQKVIHTGLCSLTVWVLHFKEGIHSCPLAGLSVLILFQQHSAQSLA